MKLKKLITRMLLIVTFIAQISIIQFNNFVYAKDEENQNSTKIQYEIGDAVQKIYNGILEIPKQKILEITTKHEETSAKSGITPITVVIPSEKKISLNRKLVINSNIEETEGIYTYQWYKDGAELEGKTNETLTIDNVTEANAGKYILKVTITVGETIKETQSNECTVTVRGFGVSIASADKTIDTQKLEPGTEFEISASINNFIDIETGIVSLAGQLEYNADILERIAITEKNGWNLNNDSINQQNLKFVTDNDNRVTEAGEIFTIKFKVKENITEAIQTTIKIKGITASGGDGVIGAKDAELAIAIQMPQKPEEPKEEKITSTVYTINNEAKDISRIAPKTTVAQFKTNVTLENVTTEPQFTDAKGKILTDDSVISTGAKIKVGKTLEYTLIVTGDMDGDGEITVNDLAKVKLHLIESELLTGIYLKAANVDNDTEITINDIAQIKLVLINLMVIK